MLGLNNKQWLKKWQLNITCCSVTKSCPTVTKSCPTICNLMNCSMTGFLVFDYLLDLLKFMSIESVMLSNNVILCCLLLILPSVFPSFRVFSNESALWSGGQSTGASVLASVLPVNIQGWFPLRLTALIFL